MLASFGGITYASLVIGLPRRKAVLISIADSSQLFCTVNAINDLNVSPEQVGESVATKSFSASPNPFATNHAFGTLYYLNLLE